ncbi:uncharacterized protein LOC144553769 [Carex rostrata]
MDSSSDDIQNKNSNIFEDLAKTLQMILAQNQQLVLQNQQLGHQNPPTPPVQPPIDIPVSLITIKLNEKNFRVWSQMVQLTLTGKDKLGWKTEDSIVKTWILNSLDPSLVGNFMLYPTAKAVWDALKRTYFEGSDESKIFELKRRANRLRQSGGSIEEYYNNLQGLWQEIDYRCPNSMKCAEDIQEYSRIIQKDRLYDFLDGLDDRLDSARAMVLNIRPLPGVEEAYGRIRQEENRQAVMLKKEVPTSVVMLAKKEEVEANLTLIIGYPDWWEEHQKKKKAEWGQTSKPRAGMAQAAGPTQVNEDGSGPTNTADVMGRAYANGSGALENGNNSEGKSNSPSLNNTTNAYYNWVIDSGATDHMTFSEKDLVNMVPPRRTQILNANGVSYPVKGAGDVPISPSMTLSNTLLVPSLSTKLLSVGQLAEDLNCVVLMYPKFCLFQDILTKEIIGRGSKQGRLYHLEDMTVGCANLAGGPSTTNKNKLMMWHKRLGHPSFGYLRKLMPSLFLNLNEVDFNCETCFKAKSHRGHHNKMESLKEKIGISLRLQEH